MRLSRTLTALDADFTETSETPHDVLFGRAQRPVLALERLSDFSHRATRTTPRPAELAELRQDLRWTGEFSAAQFAGRLRDYRRTLGGAVR